MGADDDGRYALLPVAIGDAEQEIFEPLPTYGETRPHELCLSILIKFIDIIPYLDCKASIPRSAGLAGPWLAANSRYPQS